MPKLKPPPFRSKFGPLITPANNNNNVIMDTLAKRLVAMDRNDAYSISLRAFMGQANALMASCPRTATLNFEIGSGHTLFWIHEPRRSAALEVCVVLPTSSMFHSMRKDLVT